MNKSNQETIRNIIKSKLGRNATTQAKTYYIYNNKLEQPSTYTLDDLSN